MTLERNTPPFNEQRAVQVGVLQIDFKSHTVQTPHGTIVKLYPSDITMLVALNPENDQDRHSTISMYETLRYGNKPKKLPVNYVRKRVEALRRVLEEDKENPQIILTTSHGYKLRTNYDTLDSG